MKCWTIAGVALTLLIQTGRAIDAAPPAGEADSLRRVYVPVEELESLLDGDQTGVLLSKQEFENLEAESRANSAQRRSPGLAITRSEFTASVEGRQLRMTGRLRFAQQRAEWRSIMLPTSGVAIEEATVAGEPAHLARDPRGLRFFHQNAGEGELVLELSATLFTVGSDQTASFQLPASGAAELKLQLPQGKRLLLDGLRVARQDNGYVIPVGNRRIQLRVTDQRREETADALLLASTAYGLQVNRGELAWRAVTDLDIHGTRYDRMTFYTPAGLELTSIDSPGLDSWTLSDDPQDDSRTRIDLLFRQPVTGSQRIVFEGVRNTNEDGSWQAPSVSFPAAASHVGKIVLRHPLDLRLRVTPKSGVTETWSAARKGKPAAESVRRFSVWREDFSLEVAAREKPLEMTANVGVRLGIDERELTLSAAADIAVRHADLHQLSFALPAEWKLVDVNFNSQSAPWTMSPRQAGTHYVTVELPPPLTADQTGRLAFTATRVPESWPPREDAVSVSIPHVQFPQATRVGGRIWVDVGQVFDLQPGEMESLRSLGTPDDVAQLAWQFDSSDYGGELSVARKPSRVSVETVSHSRLDPDIFTTRWLANFQVTGGGVRELTISVPEQFHPQMQFRLRDSSARIIEQSAAPVVNGERAWSLRFDRNLVGSFALTTNVTQDRDDNTEAYVVPALTVADADRQSGFVAVEAASDQRLNIVARESAVDDAAELAEVAPDELPRTPYRPRERIVGSYRAIRAGHRVTISASEFPEVGVPVAVCHVLTMDSVLTRTGMQHRATVSFTATGVQSLLVTLPESSRLWATEVDGTPVEVRRRGEQIVVPMRLSGAQSGTHTLRLFYDGPANREGGQLTQSPPQFAVVTGQGAVQSLEILDRIWNVSYPPETLVTGSAGAFVSQDELETASLVEEWLQSLRTMRLRDNRQAATVVAVLAALLVAYLIGSWWSPGVGLLAMGGVVVIGVIVSMLVTLFTSSRLSDLAEKASSEAPKSAMRASAKTAKTMAMRPPRAKNKPQVMFDRTESMEDETESKHEMPKDTAKAPQAIEGDTDGSQQKGGRGLPDQFRKVNVDPLENPPANEPDRGERITRLSLSLEFAPPATYGTHRFRYAGAAEDAPRLVLTMGDRRRGDVVRWACLCAAALLGWACRRRTAAFRSAFALLGVFGTMGVLFLVGALWRPALEGVAFGVVLAALLWLLRAVVLSLTARRLAVASLCIVIGGFGDLHADEKRAATRAISADTVIVPYDAATNPLASDRVLLSHEQYRKLWDAAHPDRPLPGNLAQTGIVRSASYVGKIAGRRLTVTGRVVLQNFKKSPIKLPLPLGEVAIRSASINGEPALVEFPPARDEQSVKRTERTEIQLASKDAAPRPLPPVESSAMLVTVPKGSHTLQFEFDLPVESRGAVNSFELPLKPVAAGRFSLELPRPDVSATVSGGVAFRWREVNEQTVMEFPIGRGGDITVTLRPKSEAMQRERTVLAKGFHQIRLGDQGETLTSRYEFQPRQGALSELAFAVPAAQKVKQITGDDIAGWQMEQAEGGRRLRVFLRREVSDRTTCTLTLFRELPIGTAEVSHAVVLPEAQDVVRETGEIAVASSEAIAVRAEQTNGLRQIDTAAQPLKAVATDLLGSGGSGSASGASRVASGLRWEFSSRPIALQLSVQRRRPTLAVAGHHRVIVNRNAVPATSRFDLDFGKLPRQRLTLELSEDYRLQSLHSKAAAVHLVDTDDEGRRLLFVEFAAPQTGNVSFTLTGNYADQPFEDGAAVFLPRPTDATRLTSQLAIWVDDTLSASIEDAEHPDWTADRGNIAATQRNASGRPAQFAYKSTEAAPEELFIALQPRPTRMSADAVTLVHVTDESVRHVLSLHWTISQGAAEVFSFITPDWLKDRLSFRAANYLRSESTDIGNGRVRWDLHVRNPQRGEFHAQATARLALPSDGRVSAVEVEFVATADEVDAPSERPRQSQHVLAVNVSRARLTLDQPETQTLVKRAELPSRIRINPEWLKLAVDIVRLQSAAAPVWRIERFEQQRGAPLTVGLADITLLIAADGTWREQVDYTVRNRSRQFLPVVLPTDSKLLSVMVRGRPIRPVTTQATDRTLHLIALPNTAAGDLSFPVRIVLSGRFPDTELPRKLKLTADEITLPAPLIPTTKENPEYGVPVLETAWTVRLPENFVASAVTETGRTNLTPADDERMTLARQRALLRDAEELLDIAPQSEVTKSRVLNNIDEVQRQIRDFSREGQSEEQQRFNSRADEVSARLRELQRNEVTERGRVPSRANEKEAADVFERNAEQQFSMNAFGSGGGLGSGGKDGRSDDNSPGRVIGDIIPGYKLPKPNTGRPAEKSPPKKAEEVNGGIRRGANENADDEKAAVDVGGADRGLSLDMTLPDEGQTLTFVKSGGNPQLVIAVRSDSTSRVAKGARWAACWAIACFAVVFIARRWQRGRALRQQRENNEMDAIVVEMV